MEFFNKCGIRAPKYLNRDVTNLQTLDIKKAYFNILLNHRYTMAIQDGNEITTVFNKKIDKILDYGFYYIKFNTMNEIDKAMFDSPNKKVWILGYLLNNLKLDVEIIYKHISSNFSDPAILTDEEKSKLN